MSSLKRSLLFAAILLVNLFGLTGSTRSMDFEKGEQVHITNLHRIPDDLYIWGSSVVIDGIVEGDLCVGGYTVSTNGQIKASANVFANEFRHTGKVDGTLRCFVNGCSIDGYVGRSLLMAGSDIRIGNRAVIEKEVHIWGNNVNFDGTAKENVWIHAHTIFISGTIGGDVHLEAQEIHINAPATIKGNLTYVSKNEANIDLASGVTIVGATSWELPKDEKSDETSKDGYTRTIMKISKLFAAFLFGVILMAFSKPYMIESTNQLRNRFSISAATGLLALVIFVLCIFVLVVATILVLAGIALLSGELMLLGALVVALSIVMIPLTSVATVCGAVMFYTGKIIFALLTGYYAIRFIKKDAQFVTRSQLLLGLVLLTILFWIPYVGVLFYLLGSIIGVGGIILGIKRCRIQLAHAQDTSIPPPPSPPSPLT